MASSLASSLRHSSSAPPAVAVAPNQRITLLDNTIVTPPPAAAGNASSDENLPLALPAQPSSSSTTVSDQKLPGRRETLRKAIAQRKYRKWGPDPFPSVASSEETLGRPSEESPDPRAAGTIERVDGDVDVEVQGGFGMDGEGGLQRGPQGGRERTDTGGYRTAQPQPRTGRKKGMPEKEVAEIDILYENQRGMFACGIPFFSSKGLLNFDPPAWQNRHHAPSLVSILNAQVPDPSWSWSWKSWYVDMTTDVDEEGWTYSFSFNPNFSWHGTHIWFHSFVRRRRWLRKRIKLPTHPHNSRDSSTERPHGLNQDYFTIHSRAPTTTATAATDLVSGADHKKRPRRSVMEGAGWSWKDEDGDGVEDSEQLEEEPVTDIPTLMRHLRGSRLDREKVQAVKSFLRDGKEELVYLPERIPDIMALMIFQASRRQLLALLVSEAEKASAAPSSATTTTTTPTTPTPPPAPLPPAPILDPSQPTSPAPSETSEDILLPPSPAAIPPIAATTEPAAPPPEPTLLPALAPESGSGPESAAAATTPDPDAARRKASMLKKAINVADAEVRRMQYWSDITDATAGGETVSAPVDGMGIGGAAHRRQGSGREIEWVEGRVDVKGKGKGKA